MFHGEIIIAIESRRRKLDTRADPRGMLEVGK